MSNVAPTVALSTIPQTSAPSAPEAASEPVTTPAAPPSGVQEPSGAASDAEKPDPHTEIAKRLEGISKREAKARRLEAEHHERMAKLAEKEKAIEERLAKLDAALSDPVKHLLDEGKDPVEVAKRFAKPETEEEKRIRKLEEQIKAREEREAAAEKEARARQEQAERHKVVREFVSEITEENAPNLVALYAAHEVPALVSELLNRRLETGETVLQAFNHTHGRNPTNAEIRESLEAEAESRATKILQSQNRRNAVATTPPASQAQVPAQPGPKGISNKHASTTASTATPRKPSREERRAKAMRELAERLEAEAATRE